MKKKKTHQHISNRVENCIFKGVEFDKSSLDVIASVARGLENLTKLFGAQNIKIESLLTIGTKENEK